MPAEVKSKVGLSGIKLELGICKCPRLSRKYETNFCRMSDPESAMTSSKDENNPNSQYNSPFPIGLMAQLGGFKKDHSWQGKGLWQLAPMSLIC